MNEEKTGKSCVILGLVPNRVSFWTELTQELLKQGYVAPNLKQSPQNYYSRHHELVDRYEISVSQMPIMDLLPFI